MCGSHPGSPAGHPEVFPYKAGYDLAVDEALATVDAARKTQMTALGLQEPAKKAPATLDANGTGWAAHRDTSRSAAATT